MKKVLVIDDDADILEAMKIMLEGAGYLVKTALNGADGYKKALSFRPNIILLDVLLSGEDGRDVAKKLKKNKITKVIPVILVSAHPSAKDSVFECGALDFITKPFDMDDLLNRVKKYVG